MKSFRTWLTCFVLGHDWEMEGYWCTGSRVTEYVYECTRCTSNKTVPTFP